MTNNIIQGCLEHLQQAQWAMGRPRRTLLAFVESYTSSQVLSPSVHDVMPHVFPDHTLTSTSMCLECQLGPSG